MNWLTRLAGTLLRSSTGALSRDRRLWLRALLAEADGIPAGWLRLAGLAGGVRLTLREAALGRRLGYPVAFAIAAAGAAWSAWSGPPGDSAVVINRVDVTAVAVILATLALCAPVAAGLAASRQSGRPVPAASAARQGALAGLCTGGAAALVVSVLSAATIALLPYAIGLRDRAATHIGQWTPAVGQIAPVVGPRLGYVAGNSAFAAGCLIVLLLGPLAGCAVGAWAGRAAGNPGPSRPQSA